MDDWRGEHLIRTVMPDTFQYKVPGKVKIPYKKPKSPVRRTCVVPSCENVLDTRNTSGVCRRHMHGAFCRCGLCARGTGKGSRW